ncbi:MAG: hypothetical protein JST55_16465 [Bacteroidetes bacterium]|nr:hypothetical protein [Bacteroidota bacterium]
MEKIKILVVEDDQEEFEQITAGIKSTWGIDVEVFPYDDVEPYAPRPNFNKLIADINLKDYQGVLNEYPKIDLIILDLSLTPGKRDENGIQFYNFVQENKSKYLSENKKNDVHFIAISILDDKKYFFDEKKIPFFPKLEYGLNIVIENLNNKIGQLFFKGLRGSVAEKKWYDKFELNSAKFEGRISRLLVDKLILFFLYLLIVGTTLASGIGLTIKLGEEYLHAVMGKEESVKKTIDLDNTNIDSNYIGEKNSKSESNNKETAILSVSENIFLYLLPVFIVLGFFNYYKANARLKLLEPRSISIDEEKSIKTMNLTKVLFTSSLISYILIKIIEMLFVKASFKKGTGFHIDGLPADQNYLIYIGIFLVILMIYFIFLDWKNHGEKTGSRKSV